MSTKAMSFQGEVMKTLNKLPHVGETAPVFSLVNQHLEEVSSNTFSLPLFLYICPSVDIPQCANDIRLIESQALTVLKGLTICVISSDLPFALGRFGIMESIKHTQLLSAFNSKFEIEYGVQITEGVLTGLMTRAMIVLDENKEICFRQQLKEITGEFNFSSLAHFVKSMS